MVRQQKSRHRGLGLLECCKGLSSRPTTPWAPAGVEADKGCGGVPLGNTQSCGVRARPGLVYGKVGSPDGDLRGGQEAGWHAY